MGWFGGAASGEESTPSAAVMQLEQQIEMMDLVFRKYAFIL
jgi:hypothetical protein